MNKRVCLARYAANLERLGIYLQNKKRWKVLFVMSSFYFWWMQKVYWPTHTLHIHTHNSSREGFKFMTFDLESLLTIRATARRLWWAVFVSALSGIFLLYAINCQIVLYLNRLQIPILKQLKVQWLGGGFISTSNTLASTLLCILLSCICLQIQAMRRRRTEDRKPPISSNLVFIKILAVED